MHILTWTLVWLQDKEAVGLSSGLGSLCIYLSVNLVNLFLNIFTLVAFTHSSGSLFHSFTVNISTFNDKHQRQTYRCTT